MLKHILYILACLIIPIGWGVMIYYLSNQIEAARARRQPTKTRPPAQVPDQLEYYI